MHQTLFPQYIFPNIIIIKFTTYSPDLIMTKTISSEGIDDSPITIVQNTRTINNPLIQNQYRSYSKLFAICFNAALSSFFIGYSLVCIGAIDFNYIVLIYGLQDWDVSKAESVVNGAVPIGAMAGALLSSQVISRLSRKNGFLVTNIGGVLCLVLIFIKNPVTLLMGRALQGICTGIFSAIVPLYINEIVTPDSSNLGSLNQILIASAQGFCFLWQFILLKMFTGSDGIVDYSWIWNLLSLFLIIPIIIQTVIFIFVFPYDTPKYLYLQGENKKAAELITKIYRQEFIDEAINRLEVNRNSFSTENNDRIGVQQGMTGIGGTNKFINNKMAIFVAINLSLLQQMDGVNAIAVYGKKTLDSVLKDHQDAIDLLQVLITSLPAVMAAFSIKLMKKKGRKFLIQMGTSAQIVCLAIVLIAIAIKGDSSTNTFYTTFLPLCVVFAMAIYMAFFGLTLGPIVWLYIPEIVQPNIIPFTTMINLTGAAICIIVFPLIDNTTGFSTFLGWSIVAFLINAKYMVQTKDKNRRKIFNEYNQMKLC